MLSIIRDDKILPVRIEYFCFDEKINEGYSVKLRFYASEKTLSRLDLGVKLDIAFLNGHVIFAYITCLDEIKCFHDAILIEAQLSSSLFWLSRQKKRRSFIEMSFEEIFSALFAGVGFQLGAINRQCKINWVQYDETNLDCVQRLLSYLDAYLNFDFSEKNWCITSFSGLMKVDLLGYRHHASIDCDAVEQMLYQSDRLFTHLGRCGQDVVCRSMLSWSKPLGFISEVVISKSFNKSFSPVVLGLQKANIDKTDKELAGKFLWKYYADSRINQLSVCMPGYTNHFYHHASPRKGDSVLLDFKDNDFSSPVVLSGLSFNADQHSIEYDESFLDLSEQETILMASQSFDLSSNEVGMTADTSGISASSLSISGESIMMKFDHLMFSVGNTGISFDNRGIDFSSSHVAFDVYSGPLGSLVTEKDTHQCPLYDGKIPHQGGPVLSGSCDVKINGLGVARAGDRAYCQGAEDGLTSKLMQFRINGKAVVVDQSQTLHGGLVISTQRRVFIA